MLATILALALVPGPACAVAPALPFAPSPHAVQEDPGDAALRKAWGRLDAKQKKDLVEWFRFEVGNLRTLQGHLVQTAIRSRDEDVGLAPEAREPRYFDPEKHAPKLPIARRWLKPDSKAVQRERERLLGKPDPRTMASSWAYDWGQRQVVRTGTSNDPEVIFNNGLLGLSPDTDIALVCLLEGLDRGEEQDVLEAFDHTYTDRKGNAYTGITLYDAWGSGRRLEMPDVDNLGIVHTLLGLKRRWKSPVPESKQESLYETVAEQYSRAKRYRGLREAVAAVYLSADPALPAGYGDAVLNFHALWEEKANSIEDLRDELPGADAWKKYLKRLARRLDKDRDLTARARTRQARLAADQAQIRAALVRVMHGSGALGD